MKLVGALLTLLIALMVEAVAGYFSVIGLAALFAAAFWPVVIMGGTLEAGKLVAATWLKANWKNRNVAPIHKAYLLVAIVALMAITSLGIYGYLAKAHLEQEANLPAIELQIRQMEARITQAESERARQESRLTQLDQSVSVLLSNAQTAKDARSANLARDAQRRDRLDVQKQITALNKEVNGLNEALVPLRLKVSDVSAKLGPVKYVASLFGWSDPNSAVQLIILLIMIAFDPLAVVMVLSGTLSLNEAAKEISERRARRRAEKAAPKVDGPSGSPGDLDHFTNRPLRSSNTMPPQYMDFGHPPPAEPKGSRVTELPKGEVDDPDLVETMEYFKKKVEAGIKIPEPLPVHVFGDEAPPEANVAIATSEPVSNAAVTYEAVHAEIERLRPSEPKDNLTVEPKTEMMPHGEVADFNTFSANHTQPNK